MSKFVPCGDQPYAIARLVHGLTTSRRNQVLLGVTGSGKTFTIANVIEKTQRPALVIAPNKILAAQLYSEFKTFFPHNAVEYFVSYYDYYQPEAYIPSTDTYIAKESSINQQIDMMRHSATRSLLERTDVIVVSSVSCLYGIGDPSLYSEMTVHVSRDKQIEQSQLIHKLVEIHYKRSKTVLKRGFFRVLGDTVEIFPAHSRNRAWRIEFFGNCIEEINEFEPMTGIKISTLKDLKIYSNCHYVAPKQRIIKAIRDIKIDLDSRLEELTIQGKAIESQRLEKRCLFDIEMLSSTGFCHGIENYSRYLSGRKPGEPPPTIFEYLPKTAILFVDESHITIGQINAMYHGDISRKSTLIEHGFRLPSCVDNRPLCFDEWNNKRPQSIFISATPGLWEKEKVQGQIVEQIIRPTGLTDPHIEVRSSKTQIDDLFNEARLCLEKGHRTMVTTITKRIAEDVAEYFHENGINARYMHSEIETFERVEILRDFRLGIFDVLVGINLLREGLDIPECALVAVLDADKEGFLRSETSLIQIMGRAARNSEGRAILYAERITSSMKRAIKETERRRQKQTIYNKSNKIIPRTIDKSVNLSLSEVSLEPENNQRPDTKSLTTEEMTQMMHKASKNLEFEKAAYLRDKIKRATKSL